MIFHILCGIPGSGKSTLCKKIDGYVISTDNIRNFMWGNASIRRYENLIFKIVDEIARHMLFEGEDVIYDATNLNRKSRAKYITLAKKYGATVVVHWINCPLNVAIERNQNRERKVPLNVIRRFYKSMKIPQIDEGIDEIRIYDKNLILLKNITKDDKY